MVPRAKWRKVKGLPKSNKPWSVRYIDIKGIQCVIATNEDHPPYIIEDDIAKELKPICKT